MGDAVRDLDRPLTRAEASCPVVLVRESTAPDAAEALAVLQKRRPERITDDRYRTLLTVLTARKTNPTATYRELAIGLQPPLSTAGFYAALRTAHQLAGVGQTITPLTSGGKPR